MRTLTLLLTLLLTLPAWAASSSINGEVFVAAGTTGTNALPSSRTTNVTVLVQSNAGDGTNAFRVNAATTHTTGNLAEVQNNSTNVAGVSPEGAFISGRMTGTNGLGFSGNINPGLNTTTITALDGLGLADITMHAWYNIPVLTGYPAWLTNSATVDIAAIAPTAPGGGGQEAYMGLYVHDANAVKTGFDFVADPGLATFQVTKNGSVIAELNNFGLFEVYGSLGGYYAENGPIYGLYEADGFEIAIDSILSSLRPSAADGTTPFVVDAATNHTSGFLFEFRHNTTNKFTGTPEGKLTAVQGFSSTATDAAVTIDATGWTNTFAKNAVVYMDGTGLTFTVYNNALTPIYTNSVTLTGASVLLQPSGKVIITAGTLGVGRATPF